MPGAAGYGLDPISLGDHGSRFLHTGHNQLAVIGNQSHRRAGSGNVHELPVADVFKQIHGLFRAGFVGDGYRIELGALAGDEGAVLIDGVQAIVGEGQLHKGAFLLAVLDDGGKVCGVQAVIAPGVDGTVLHQDGGDLVSADQLTNLGGINGALQQLLGLLSGGGDHAALPAVLAVVKGAPAVDLSLFGNGHAVVGACGNMNDLAVLNLLGNVHNVQPGILGFGVVSPHIQVAIRADTNGKGSPGGNIYRAILHIGRQLHQAHGGSHIGVQHLTAGFGQIHRVEHRPDEHKQEHTDQNDQRDDRDGLAEEPLDGQLGGAVIPLALLGNNLGAAEEHSLQPIQGGKTLGGSILFHVHPPYLFTRTRGSAMP